MMIGAWIILLAAGHVIVPIDDDRPLAALADELEKRYQVIVTYEDSPVEQSKTTVSFEYTVPKDGLAVSDLLSQLLVQYHGTGAAARFRVEGADGLYHLIPAVASPLLSTPIHLEDKERTVDETIEEILAQLSAGAQRVDCTYFPLNLFHQTRIRMAADGEPARHVLRRILQKLRLRTTWRLHYDPEGKSAYLIFLILPEKPTSECVESTITIQRMPLLGDHLSNLPTTCVETMVSSGQTWPSYEANIDGIKFTVGVDKIASLRFISTSDPSFSPPEGLHVGDPAAAAQKAVPAGPMMEEPGWGSYIELPSGWYAFIDDTRFDPSGKPVDMNLGTRPLGKDATIRFFFRRD